MCCSFHETEEDGAERLHSAARRKLLRLQAVSTSLTHVTVTVLMEKEKKQKTNEVGSWPAMLGFDSSEGEETKNPQ